MWASWDTWYTESHAHDPGGARWHIHGHIVRSQTQVLHATVELGSGARGLKTGISSFLLGGFGKVQPATVDSKVILWLSLVVAFHDTDL